MNDDRDHPAAERQAAITRACGAAGRILAMAHAEQEEIAAQGGPEAVAAWACPSGSDEERAATAAYYRQLQARAAGGSTAEDR